MRLRSSVRAATLLAALWVSCVASAQSNIDPDQKHAWSENIGWTNWFDAGVFLHPAFLEGFVWLENAGWLKVGLGGPYANTSGTDFGVNVAPNGDLSGFAWSENLGWFNFDTSVLGASARARFDSSTGRFTGYVWGENCGWVNLDDPTHFVRVQRFIRGDCDGDGTFNALVDAMYLLAFGFGGGMPPPCLEAADADGDGILNPLVDALWILAHGFQNGPPPPAPYPDCGPDPDPTNSLGCANDSGCNP